MQHRTCSNYLRNVEPVPVYADKVVTVLWWQRWRLLNKTNSWQGPRQTATNLQTCAEMPGVGGGLPLLGLSVGRTELTTCGLNAISDWRKIIRSTGSAIKTTLKNGHPWVSQHSPLPVTFKRLAVLLYQRTEFYSEDSVNDPKIGLQPKEG